MLKACLDYHPVSARIRRFPPETLVFNDLCVDHTMYAHGYNTTAATGNGTYEYAIQPAADAVHQEAQQQLSYIHTPQISVPFQNHQHQASAPAPASGGRGSFDFLTRILQVRHTLLTSSDLTSRLIPCADSKNERFCAVSTPLLHNSHWALCSFLSLTLSTETSSGEALAYSSKRNLTCRQQRQAGRVRPASSRYCQTRRNRGQCCSCPSEP